ncbi:hypothetical protein [Reyranella sp.]|uniref:hypothetical protein n=1 Tax=Reyranella sp. TaxID=1929291 RepID=UPI003D0C8828
MQRKSNSARKAKAAPVSGVVQWSTDVPHPVIEAENRHTPRIQAGVWHQAATLRNEAREAAHAIRQWRRDHAVLYGDIVLDVLAASCADAVIALTERMDAFLRVSPRLRREVEAIQRSGGGTQ